MAYMFTSSPVRLQLPTRGRVSFRQHVPPGSNTRRARQYCIPQDPRYPISPTYVSTLSAIKLPARHCHHLRPPHLPHLPPTTYRPHPYPNLTPSPPLYCPFTTLASLPRSPSQPCPQPPHTRPALPPCPATSPTDALPDAAGQDRQYVGDVYAHASSGSYLAQLLVGGLPPRPPVQPPPVSPEPPSPPTWYNVATQTVLPTTLIDTAVGTRPAATQRSSATAAAVHAHNLANSSEEPRPVSFRALLPGERVLQLPVPPAASSNRSASLVSAGTDFDGGEILQMPAFPPANISPPPPPPWFQDGTEVDLPTRE